MSNRSVHSERSRVKNDDCETCTYCNLEMVAMHHEHDHAPIPKNAGGTALLPACITCHDMKDRVTFPNWPAAYLIAAVVELRDAGRLEDFGGTPPDAIPDDWRSLSRWARIVWAKMAKAAHERPDLVPEILALSGARAR